MAAIKGVREYGLEGVRVQNISKLAGLTQGAMYRYFESKDDLMTACFVHVDKQAAAIFDHMQFDPQALAKGPAEAIRSLWLPYFRFWTSHPDETVFYHRFRDSAAFPKYDRERDAGYFSAFAWMVNAFMTTFPGLRRINQDLLWLHVLTTTVLYAKYVVEGMLPNDEETENAIFQLMIGGLSEYIKPGEK